MTEEELNKRFEEFITRKADYLDQTTILGDVKAAIISKVLENLSEIVPASCTREADEDVTQEIQSLIDKGLGLYNTSGNKTKKFPVGRKGWEYYELRIGTMEFVLDVRGHIMRVRDTKNVLQSSWRISAYPLKDIEMLAEVITVFEKLLPELVNFHRIALAKRKIQLQQAEKFLNAGAPEGYKLRVQDVIEKTLLMITKRGGCQSMDIQIPDDLSNLGVIKTKVTDFLMKMEEAQKILDVYQFRLNASIR